MNPRLTVSGIIFVIMAIFVATSCTTFAQGVPSNLGGIELTTSNNNPQPGQNVVITAKNYSRDINSATLTWTTGGKTLAKGLGVTSITVQAPTLGKQLDVVVTAILQDGTSLVSMITINSSSVDMIVEPGGFVPSMFMGKIPVSYQNTIRVIAVPHLANSRGVEYDPQTLVYKWEQGSNVLQSQSGYGKQSINIQGGIIPRPFLVTVTVTTRDGLLQGVGTVNINQTSPFIVFYKNDPLYGSLYNIAVGNTIYLGSQREVGVIAAPYGFNVPATGVGELSLSWFINDVEHPELASNKSVTLRAPNNAAGSSNIQLNITHKNEILERSQASFRAVFNAVANNAFEEKI